MAKKSRSRRKPRARTPKKEAAQEPVEVKELDEEYSYVVNDLRTIGIIAAILIGGLVVLSFFI